MALDLILQWGFGDGCEPPLCIGDILKIEVTANQSCDGYFLKFDGDSYFSRAEAIVRRKKAVIELYPLADVSILNLKQITLNLFDKTKTKKVASITPSLRVHYFTGDITKNDIRPRANILLFGLQGSGKSTFVNSALSTVSGDDTLISIAVAGGASGHVTTEFGPYRLVDYKNAEPVRLTRFALMDTWGLTRDNFKDHEFACMLQGNLPKGFVMNESPLKLKFNKEAAKRNASHSVIFFLPIGELQTDVETLLIKKMKSFVEQATRTGRVNSYIAITQVDRIYPNFPQDGSSPEKEIKRAVNFFNLPPGQICPIIGLLKNKHDFEAEKRLYHLVLSATCTAGQKVDFDNPIIPKDDDDFW